MVRVLKNLAAVLCFVSVVAEAEETKVTASNGVVIQINLDDFADRTEYSAPAIDFSTEQGDSGFLLLAAVKSAGNVTAPYLVGYIYYSDDWRRYSQAIFKGGSEAQFQSLDRKVVSCSNSPCKLTEGFQINVSERQVQQYAEGGKLSMQVRGQSSSSFIISVPVSYFSAIREISQR